MGSSTKREHCVQNPEGKKICHWGGDKSFGMAKTLRGGGSERSSARIESRHHTMKGLQS